MSSNNNKSNEETKDEIVRQIVCDDLSKSRLEWLIMQALTLKDQAHKAEVEELLKGKTIYRSESSYTDLENGAVYNAPGVTIKCKTRHEADILHRYFMSTHLQESDKQN